jgi:hypothetical protein
MIYTHKGWFFLCPIYCNPNEGEGMHVDARYRWLDWWFDVQMYVFNLLCVMITSINPEYEPMFPFKITGEL